MNDIEKKLRKRGMAKLDKFAKNPYKVPKLPWYKRIPLWTKVVVPTAALTTALFVVVLNTIPGGEKSSQKPTSQQTSYPSAVPATSSKAPTPFKPSGQISYKHWGNLTINQKFAYFNYEGNSYAANFTDTIPEANVDSYVADIVLSARDEIGVLRTIDAGVYSVKNRSTDEILALRFSSDNKFYAYYRMIN